MGSLTSNQYYGGVNRRLRRRAALLHRFGFRFQGVTVPVEGAFKPVSLGAWVRVRCGRADVLPATVLGLADNRAWLDELRRVLTCGRCYRLPL